MISASDFLIEYRFSTELVRALSPNAPNRRKSFVVITRIIISLNQSSIGVELLTETMCLRFQISYEIRITKSMNFIYPSIDLMFYEN